MSSQFTVSCKSKIPPLNLSFNVAVEVINTIKTRAINDGQKITLEHLFFHTKVNLLLKRNLLFTFF